MNGFTMSNPHTPSAPPLAAGCYTSRYLEALDLLTRIASRLASHQARQGAAPADGGYPDSLDYINQRLARVLALLGGRSAVEQKGLEY
jgi:hypothetical protein